MINASQRAKLRLYLVSPEGWGEHPHDEKHLAQLIEAGVGTVQFREKLQHPDRQQRAKKMRDVAKMHGALFLVNDDPDLALLLNADGVHVGVDDATVRMARYKLGADKIVGATARTLARAQQAIDEGADYLGVGAIYDATASKPDAQTIGLEGFQKLKDHPQLQSVPMVAIGGICVENARECWEAGADGVAMIRGLWNQRPPFVAIKSLRKK